MYKLTKKIQINVEKTVLNNSKKKSNENYKILKNSVDAFSITTVCTAKNKNIHILFHSQNILLLLNRSSLNVLFILGI